MAPKAGKKQINVQVEDYQYPMLEMLAEIDGHRSVPEYIAHMAVGQIVERKDELKAQAHERVVSLEKEAAEHEHDPMIAALAEQHALTSAKMLQIRD